MMSQNRRLGVLLLAVYVWSMPHLSDASDWLTVVPLTAGEGQVRTPADGRVYFLRFGEHAYEPTGTSVRRDEQIVIAPFQQLQASAWNFPANTTVDVKCPIGRDAFWDQIITLDRARLDDLPKYRVVDSGEFAGALPSHTIPLSSAADRTDPVIPAKLDRELSWDDIAAKALPLDFQKVLLASLNDSSPAFTFQNGQWLTTWLSRDLPKWNKEDHWFAPALLIGDELIRPAPLSARTSFLTTPEGVTVPLWTLEWSHGGTTIRQEMFSHRTPPGAEPRLFVRLQMMSAPAGAKIALGMGRRPNVHWWDEKSRERSPIAFFSLEPKYRADGRRVIDASEQTILESAQPFELQKLGPVEMLAVFDVDSDSAVYLVTPQSESTAKSAGLTKELYDAAKRDFIETWSKQLRFGAQVRLPSSQWMQRIDIWRSQVASITRVHYQKEERLSYGAYFYQYYFGIEEGWPVVAMALWGDGTEAQLQAEIMLTVENLAKDNVHHQSRNGAAAWSAAAVARLTHDRAWLKSIAPRLIECARWTQRVRGENQDARSPLTRGLLPPHIYGGDVRDPATSLYATVACWRGLVDTAVAFRELGDEELVREADWMDEEARSMRSRIDHVIREVAVGSDASTFLPFALELPSLDGRNEGPHDQLTATRFGNYWNLFAPSFLELNYGCADDPTVPNRWIFDYMQQHGGLWGGLPRFYSGLDAVYSRGSINYLLQRSAVDIRARHQALASLQSFFLHAASRNGYTIPEVAGLFPYRFDRKAYENIVRESPWNFGMYDANRYLEGHISFTEPLGAGAGEALWLVRDALLTETRDDRGLPDGGLVVLPTVPSDWFDEGKEIVLKEFPTAYGTLIATIRSTIHTKRQIVMEYEFKPFDAAASTKLKNFRVRFAPVGEQPVEVEFDPRKPGAVRATF